MRIAGLRKWWDLSREGKMFIKNKTKVACRMSGIQWRVLYFRKLPLETNNAGLPRNVSEHSSPGEWSVRKWVTSIVDGMHTSTTGRLVPTSRHKEDMERCNFVQNFLRDLPKLPSHCWRATTSKEFLDPQFQSIGKVHRVFEEQQAGRFHLAKYSRPMYTLACISRKRPMWQCSAFTVGNREKYDEHYCAERTCMNVTGSR